MSSRVNRERAGGKVKELLERAKRKIIFQADCQGFVPDTQCGNCHCEYPIKVYPAHCPNPQCGSSSAQVFHFGGPPSNYIFAGGLPMSLWQSRQRVAV